MAVMTTTTLGLWMLFAVLLVCIAFLYSSVGHGGASGYIALMAAFSYPISYIKPTALILNIAISGVAFIYFKKYNHFTWSLFYPFAIASIPAAFIGGFLDINTKLYKIVLAFFLMVAILRLMGVLKNTSQKSIAFNTPLALGIGFVIGLFSGMIGIGGGIILTPVILLLGWGKMKVAAAVSALFIFVNSIAGIVGYSIHHQISTESFRLVPIALIGGVLGAIYGSNKGSQKALKYVLTTVLLVACFKLILY